jgi:SNF2 family DNA or RNA helicase
MSILATTDGRRILVHFPFSRSDLKLVKGIAGAKPHYIDDKFDAWWLPLTMDSCRGLRRQFGDRLMVANALSRWARAEIAREIELEGLRSNVPVEMPFVKEQAPALWAAMQNRSYQPQGTGFIKVGGQVILGDDPGLGKTLQTLAALIESDCKRILVACPRTACRVVWERETQRWAPGIATFVAQGSHAEREAVMGAFDDHSVGIPWTRKMLIINTEMIRAKRTEVCPAAPGVCPREQGFKCAHRYLSTPDWPYLHNNYWDAIVLDESHNSLASTANYQSKRITQVRFGAVQLRRRLAPGGVAAALSGTPFRSDLLKAWGTLNWLRPDVFGSFWRFAETHFRTKEGYTVGSKVFVDENGEETKNPQPIDEERFQKALRPYYLKRTKAMAAPDLPPIAYAGTPSADDPSGENYVRLDLDPKQAKAYATMSKMAEADIQGGKLYATGVLAEITRKRQLASSMLKMQNYEAVPILPSNKIDWIVEFAAEKRGNAGKLVVASSFSQLVELSASVLRDEGHTVLTLTGGTSDRGRMKLVQRFQDPDDECRIVVINRKAGGESITLDLADDMVLIDQPWKSDEDEQLVSRIHRVSRIHPVTVWRLCSLGTIDEWMAGLTQEQRELLSRVGPDHELIKEARAA